MKTLALFCFLGFKHSLLKFITKELRSLRFRFWFQILLREEVSEEDQERDHVYDDQLGQPLRVV